MHTPEKFTQLTEFGKVTVAVTRQVIDAPADFYVPYEGSNPLVKAAFPVGFLPSYGSGLAFKEQLDSGELEFYCLTDRGPNGDGPNVPAPNGDGLMGSKIFPAPGFTPSIGVLHVSDAAAKLVSRIPIRISEEIMASGLPIPHGSAGSSAEVPLFDDLCPDVAGRIMFDAGGIDSEAIAWDPKRQTLWVADEYGPFLLRIDPATGIIQQRYAPGSGLPEVLALRRANRGMEGMTIDPASDRIHAFLQSPLSDGKARYSQTGKEEKVERFARFLRWVEFDPESGSTVRMLAYPLDGSLYHNGRTGNAKLGDLVALGNGKFIVIEQGEGAHGAMINYLMLVDINGATDIGAAGFNPATSDLEKSSMRGEAVDGADWSRVVPVQKTLLLNLNDIGWVAEKAEGLALVDAHTLAMTNDNDFGLKTRVYDARGAERALDVTDIEVDAAGRIVAGADSTDKVRIAQGDAHERPLTLWRLRFEQPLASLG
jgi:hypothetical protein